MAADTPAWHRLPVVGWLPVFLFLVAGGRRTEPSLPAPQAPQQRADSLAAVAVRSALEAGFQAKSAGRVAGSFLGTGVMIRGAEALVGADAIRDAMGTVFGGIEGPNPLVFTPRSVRVGAEAVLDEGLFGPRGGDPVGRYVMVSQRDPTGRWAISWMRWYRE